jgi:hypothetical protein
MDRFSFEDGAHDRQLLLGAKRYAVLELWYRLLLAAGPGQRPRMAAYVTGTGPQGGDRSRRALVLNILFAWPT